MILKILSLFVITSFLWLTSYSQTTFTLIENHPITDLMQKSEGMAWGDFDDDGDEDLFLCNFNGPNRLFRNDGGGVFTEINPGSVFDKLNGTTVSVTASWGDFNNDGYLDLYVANRLVGTGSDEKRNYIYENNGDGTFTQRTTQLFSPTNNTYGVAWADYNLDGHLDAAEVSSPSAFMNLFENTGDEDFTRIQFGVNNAYNNGLSWADFDNDGFPELFVATDDENFLFDNDGTSLTQILTGPVATGSAESNGGSWGDYDNDGDLDLFVANGKFTAAANFLFRNDNGSFTQINSGEIVTDVASSKGSAWGDYDNDGFLDLYVINASPEPNALYRNNGDGTFTRVTGEDIADISGSGRSCSWIDYNQDGFLDLYFTEFDHEKENPLFENNGNANHWITVKLKGTVSNRAAIGAKVRVYAEINGANTGQLREVSGQTGYAAQAGLFAHFGLGDATAIDSLVIEWPSGIKQRHVGMAIDQLHTIVEILPPAQATDLQATVASFSQIDLIWTDNADNETEYVIERSAGDDSNFSIIATLPAGAESYSDENLTGSTAYYYRVTAKNESEPTTPATVNATTDPAPVNAPSDLIAAANSPTEIQLSWTDNSDDETGFILERKNGSDPATIILIAADETSYTDTDNLEEDTEYQYRIKAESSDGQSSYSNTVTVTTPPFINAPENLTATAISHDKIGLAWTDNSANETGFVIERSVTEASGFSPVHTAAADETAYEDSDALDPETTYYYRVKAINATHESKYTAEADATTLEYTPVTLSFPDRFVQPGEEIVIPVLVGNFTNVRTAQFEIKWDPAVLNYDTVENEALSDMTFGGTTASGSLTFSWDDMSGTAQTLPDGTALFAIRFSAVGGDGTSSVVEIPSAGVPALELGNSLMQVMDVETTAGTISVHSLAILSGTVRNAKGNVAPNVEVTLSGDDNQTATTAADGTFSFQVLPGSHVTLTPAKETEPIIHNGISTLDIALIRRHILSPLKLADPYQLIAADVNNSNHVSTIDIGMIREVILNKKTSFNDAHWKFIPASFPFADPDNPFPYDQEIIIPSAVNQPDLDFIGVRLGDVNYSWDNTKARTSSGETIAIRLPELESSPGNVIRVPLKVKNFNDIAAFQFTVTWDKKAMEFVELSQNLLNAYFSDHKAGEGYLTVAWDETAGQSASLKNDDTLMEIAFKVKDLSGETSLDINSELTQSIAYNGALEEVTIQSRPGKVSLPGFMPKFMVHQNHPNPFDASGTLFSFELPEPGEAKIVIFNAIGKRIFILEDYYAAGSHQVEWLPSQSLPDGLYFYQIESNGHSETKRMIKRE